jgi:hypothetical protein
MDMQRSTNEPDVYKICEEAEKVLRKRIKPPQEDFELKDLGMATSLVQALQHVLNTGDTRLSHFDEEPYLKTLL